MKTLHNKISHYLQTFGLFESMAEEVIASLIRAEAPYINSNIILKPIGYYNESIENYLLLEARLMAFKIGLKEWKAAWFLPALAPDCPVVVNKEDSEVVSEFCKTFSFDNYDQNGNRKKALV